MPHLEIRLFGHLELVYDGRPHRFRVPPKAAALMAYLLVHAGETLSRPALAATLWPDDPDDEARGKIRRHLHRIARALPVPPNRALSWIDVTATTVGWRPNPEVWVDLHEFERAASDPAGRARAIDLYRGEFLEGYFEDWVLLDRERYQSQFLEACYDAALDARRERDFDAAVRYAERMLAVDEWREDALRLAMTARYESGDRSTALAAFERFSTRLRSEMRVDPMPETLALRAAILESAAVPGSQPRESDDGGPQAGGAFPLVGRDAEFEALENVWLRAARGSGATVFLGGTAGIGKSRLVAELSARAGAQGGRVLYGGTSNPEAHPYEALSDALRRSVPMIAEAQIDRPILSALAQLLPEVRSVAGDLPDPPEVDPEKARTRLLDAIARTFERLARARPLLLVLEDVHWAQGATLDAIDTIARRAGALPFLMVVTFRSDETRAAHPLSALRRRLQSERRATTVSLKPLAESDVERLTSLVRGVPPELAGAIYAQSEGNPLFAVQLLRSYAETGELPTGVPGTIAATIRARIESLDDRVRTLAETASVAGRSFTVEVVTRVLGWREDEVLDALGTLLDRSIVREAGGGEFAYTFTHALIADTIYQATPAEHRAHRHRRIAQVYAQVERLEHGALSTLARHWEAAGDKDRAAAAYVRAAEAAVAVFARDEARAMIAQARALALQDGTRFEALLVACTMGAATADVTGWDADIAELEALGAKLDDVRRMIALRLRRRYARQIADVQMQERTIAEMERLAASSGCEADEYHARMARGVLQVQLADLEGAVASFTRALEFQLTDIERLRSLEHLSTVYARRGDMISARKALQEAAAICDRMGAPPAVRLDVLSGEATIAQVEEDGPWMESIGRALLEVASLAGDVFQEAKAHYLLGHGGYFRYDFEAVRSNYARAMELFEQIGEMDALRIAYANVAEMERRIGRSERALEMLNESERLGGFEAAGARSSLEGCRAGALLAQGRTDEALACAQRAVDAAKQGSEDRVVDEVTGILGRCEMQAGRTESAIEHFAEAIALARAREGWYSLAEALIEYVPALVRAGRGPEAAAAGRELEALFERHPRVVEPARICLALARAAEAAGDAKAEAAWLERGARALEEALAKFADPVDRQAFASLEFSRALLGAQSPAGGR